MLSPGWGPALFLQTTLPTLSLILPWCLLFPFYKNSEHVCNFPMKKSPSLVPFSPPGTGKFWNTHPHSCAFKRSEYSPQAEQNGLSKWSPQWWWFLSICRNFCLRPTEHFVNIPQTSQGFCEAGKGKVQRWKLPRYQSCGISQKWCFHLTFSEFIFSMQNQWLGAMIREPEHWRAIWLLCSLSSQVEGLSLHSCEMYA